MTNDDIIIDVDKRVRQQPSAHRARLQRRHREMGFPQHCCGPVQS